MDDILNASKSKENTFLCVNDTSGRERKSISVLCGNCYVSANTFPGNVVKNK